MTTENNQLEDGDGQVTVVEQAPASATPATSGEAEVTAPGGVQSQATETQAHPHGSGVEQVEQEESHHPAFPYPQGSTFADKEGVRPFTDFIEEFRSAEARFGPAGQEPQAEPFSSLLSTTGPDGSEFTAATESHGGATEDAVVPPAPGAEGRVPAEQEKAAQPQPTVQKERPVSPLLRPATRMRPPRHGGGRQREDVNARREAEQAKQVQASEASAQPAVASAAQVESAPAESAPVEEQPRPARRYRFDRPAPVANTANAPAPAPVTPVQVRPEEGRDNRGAAFTAPRTDNGQVSGSETQPPTKQNGSPAQYTEQQVPKQTPVQEPAPANAGGTAVTSPAASTHDRRRRHGQDRQREKEQTPAQVPLPTPAAPVAEVTVVAAEPVVLPAQEVAPEDLPPLEYSELQAATSRRRRRRRPASPSSSATVTPGGSAPIAARPAVPEQPAAMGTLPAALTPVPAPVSPAAQPRGSAVPGVVPAAGAGQYNIVSGYTVSQMNQGEGAGPFMGPEPSPARGSTTVREIRPLRGEAQRTHNYPARTGDAIAAPASINHLANVITQAFQTQTDRMVSELRRANQVPTNVSVSFPPFPSNERVGVFVDVANLLYSARTLRMTVDFGKLLDFLRGNRRLVRAHAYCPTSPQPGEDQMFLQAVKGLGYRITTKNYKTFSSGAKKADLDLDLCMDVVRLVDGNAVDCIVLVSGDSDFMPMLDYCSDHGVRVEVAAFDESMSATLRQSCDLFINLSMLDEIRA